MRVKENDEYQSASLIGGFPTCVFRSKPYHRIITGVDVGNSIASTVSCHRGIIGTSPVAQSVLGTGNSLKGDIVIPAGQAFLVRWTRAGANVRDAFARVSWDRDDERSGTSSSVLSWSLEAESSIQTARSDQLTTSTVQTIIDMNKTWQIGRASCRERV